ncbi:MAG TPA: glycosyltransferase family 2 protein [Acidobacteriaceae bacterium]|jgi:glycosyltransferase involved in cell wall biosynthesis
MPDRPLLTMAIPTWNRAPELAGLLEVLLGELRHEPRVELVVSDNASTDGTAELLADYQGRGLEMRILRNEANIGADRNILQCFEQARGKYVWIFSDDDLIERGSMGRVMRSLSGREYDLVGIRYYSFAGEYRDHRKYRPTSDQEYSRTEDLAAQMHVFFTFISGIIVNKERIEAEPHRPFASLVGTNLVQLGPYFLALNRHRRSLLIRDPIIAARSNVSVGYALYRVFGPNMRRIADDWVESPRVRSAITGGTLRVFFPFWIMRGRQSHVSSVTEDPHEVLSASFKDDARYWIFDYPIYSLPLPLARLWLFGIRVTNKLNRIIMDARASL